MPILLDAAPLPVRFFLLRDIVDGSEGQDLAALQKNLRKHQPRRRILGAQDAKGLWPLDKQALALPPEKQATLQLLTQMEQLHELRDLATTGKQEKALLGMREVIRILAEQEIQLRLHHQTQAIDLSIHYDLEGNPIIKDLIREILSRQNKDGGWSSLASEKESCLWTTLYLLNTLADSSFFKTNKALRKGLEYVLEHLLRPDVSTLLPGMQAWDTLTRGGSGLSLITGGSLRVLELHWKLEPGQRNARTNKLVDWLLDVQLKNALWPGIVGRDTHGDHMVTFQVLRTLKHYLSLRV